MEPLVAAALHALDRTALPWLLLRGQDDLAHPSGDVDILVSSELLPVLDGSLEAVGFRRVLAPGHGSHRFYFCYSTAAGAWVKLDIVSDIAFGPYQQWRTALAQPCLGRRVRSGPLWLPAPPDQAWLQLLHLFLDKQQIAPLRVEAARHAAAEGSADDSVAGYVDRCMGPGTSSNLPARTSFFKSCGGRKAESPSSSYKYSAIANLTSSPTRSVRRNGPMGWP